MLSGSKQRHRPQTSFHTALNREQANITLATLNTVYVQLALNINAVNYREQWTTHAHADRLLLAR